jgi:hypothetical protein
MTLNEALEQLEAMKWKAADAAHGDPSADGYVLALAEALDILAEVDPGRTNPSIDEALTGATAATSREDERISRRYTYEKGKHFRNGGDGDDNDRLHVNEPVVASRGRRRSGSDH